MTDPGYGFKVRGLRRAGFSDKGDPRPVLEFLRAYAEEEGRIQHTPSGALRPLSAVHFPGRFG